MAKRMLKPSDIKYLVVHCSATPPDMDIGAKEIDKWHKQRGWFGIGYHYVITRNGDVEKGREENVIGAHVRGYNHESLGICLIGGVDRFTEKPEKNFTESQFETLKQLLSELKETYTEAKIVGHRDLNPHKACPSFDVSEWLKENNLIEDLK